MLTQRAAREEAAGRQDRWLLAPCRHRLDLPCDRNQSRIRIHREPLPLALVRQTPGGRLSQRLWHRGVPRHLASNGRVRTISGSSVALQPDRFTREGVSVAAGCPRSGCCRPEARHWRAGSGSFVLRSRREWTSHGAAATLRSGPCNPSQRRHRSSR